MHLALNILQWLICHKTQTNQTKPNHVESVIYFEKKKNVGPPVRNR